MSSLMRAVLVAAVVVLVASAYEEDFSVNRLTDELELVEMQGTCANEIRSAKTTCGEKLAYYKKMHETNCGQTELSAVLSRIRKNHSKAKAQQAALKRAEDALRQVKYDEKGVAKMAAQAKERLLKAMGKEAGLKAGLSKDESNVLNELRDEKSLRSQAHRATLKAIRYAETKKDFAPAKTEGGRAKGLYAKMVDEKVKIARDKYLAGKDKGGINKEKKTVAQLKKEAEAAREKEQKALEKVKTQTKKVAADNVAVSKTEVKTAKEEKSASKTEKKSLEKQVTKAKKVTKEGMKKLETSKTTLKKYEMEQKSAQSVVTKIKTWDLKKLLAQAGSLLKP